MNIEITSDQLETWKNEQNKLKENILYENMSNNFYDSIKYIGGVDISFDRNNPDKCCAYLIILNFDDLSVVYEDYIIGKMTIPYISGFLGFREIPYYKKLIDNLKMNKPDLIPSVIMIDGFGILHHRGFGSASHLGVICDIPTIGCAKTLLCLDGLYEKEIKKKFEEDSISEINLIGKSGMLYGTAILTGKLNPIYVSIGHKINLETAIKITKKCCNYRIPEPIRLADIKSKLYL